MYGVCMVYFVTYLIPCFMCQQLGSVCEGILWSDSRPVEEEGGQGWREPEKEREREKSNKDYTFHFPHTLNTFFGSFKLNYTEQTKLFCLQPNLTNNIHYCETQWVVCTNVSEAALPS